MAEEDSKLDLRINRRKFVRGIGTGITGGLAGCGAGGKTQTSTQTQGSTPTELINSGVTGTTTSTQTSPDGFDAEIPWNRLPGPQGGPVTNIDISAADPDWVYATTITAGLFVSSDGGKNWIQGPMGAHHRQFISVSPHDPQVAYSQAERTGDGGRTWINRHDGREQYRHLIVGEDVDDMGPLEFDPFDERILYIPTSDGLYRTLDGGRNWNRMDLEGFDPAQPIGPVVTHPANEGEMLATIVDTAVLRSTDRGETWSVVSGTEDLISGYPRGLAYTSPASNEAYLLQTPAIYRIGGGTPVELTERDFRFQGEHPFNSLAADGNSLYFTDKPLHGDAEDLGLYVYDVPADKVKSVATPAIPLAVATHPEDPSTLYVGGRKWIYESTDEGHSWEPRPDGFIDHYLATVEVNPTRPGTIIPGSICSAGVFVSYDDGESFDWKRSGLKDTYRADLFPGEDAHAGNFLEHYIREVAAYDDFIYVTSSAGLLISSDNGRTWKLLVNEFSGRGSFFEGRLTELAGVAVNPENPRVVYVGTGIEETNILDDTFIMKSEDGGQTWADTTPESLSGHDTEVRSILVSQHDSDIVYAGTHERSEVYSIGEGMGIYQSSDAGKSWKELDAPFVNVEAIAEDSSDPKRLYSTTPEGVYRSEDMGANWESVLPYEAKGLLTHPNRSGVVFVGAQTDPVSERPPSQPPVYWDLFISIDGGDTWGEANLTIKAGLEDGPREYDGVVVDTGFRFQDRGQIMQLALDESTSHLYAAIRGAGLWRAELDDVLDREG